jgi:hypothetical protein
MKQKIRDQGLGIAFALLFVLALIGQSFAGLGVYNEDQIAHGSEPIGYGQFVTSNNFVVDVAEN